MAIKDYYTETFIIESPSTTVSDIGGWTPSYSTLSTILGAIDELTGQDQNIAKQYIDKATHILFCSSTVTITSKYRVTYDSEYYRVLNVDNPVKRSHHLEVLLEYNESDNLST